MDEGIKTAVKSEREGQQRHLKGSTDMRIDALCALAMGLMLCNGCVSHSSAEDMSSVQSLIEQRAQLKVIERAPEHSEDPEEDVTHLLGRPLSVEDAVRIALLNNHDLRADIRSLGVARGRLVQAGLLPNPNFDVEARVPQGPNKAIQWDLSVEFDLTRTILVPRGKGVAEAELEATRFRVAGAVLDLAFRVRLAFYDLQATQQLLGLQRTTLSAFAASYDAAKALHDAGNITALDLSTEQAAYETARVTVGEVESDFQDARERLNSLLGLFGRNRHWQISDRFPQPPTKADSTDGFETRAVQTSIELAEARSQLTAQARRIGLTRTAGWLPDINVGVHAEHDGSYWEIGPAIGGSLPFFDRQQGRILSFGSEFAAIRERYVATAISLRAAVRAARNRMLSAQTRAAHYQQVVLPLRERVVAETLLQYNAMQVGVFQLLQARRDQVTVASMYINTLREYWQTRAALEQLLAGRLTGTLEQVVNSRVESSLDVRPADAAH